MSKLLLLVFLTGSTGGLLGGQWCDMCTSDMPSAVLIALEISITLFCDYFLLYHKYNWSIK